MRFKILVLTVIIISAFFRFAGTNPGFNPYHPDEGKAGYISAWLMYQDANLDPLDYTYPTLIPLVQLAYFTFIYFPLLGLKAIFTNPYIGVENLNHFGSFLKEIAINQPELPIMYQGRYLTALFSVLTVVLTYFVAKSLYSSRIIGFFSIIILAVSYRVILNSHIDIPDTFNSFFLLLAFWVVLQLKKNPNRKWYLLSGIFMGLSFSVKLQFFSFLPFAILHTIISFREKKNIQQIIQSLFSKKAFIAGFILISTIILVNFNEIIRYEEFSWRAGHAIKRYGVGRSFFNTTAVSYLYHVGLTPPIFIAVILGFFVALKKNFLSTLLLFGVLGSSLYLYLYATLGGGYYTRNFVTIIPFMYILAGLFFESIYNLLTKLSPSKLLANIIMGLILFIALFQSFSDSLLNVRYNLKPWGLTTTRKWLSENIENGTTIASHPWDKYILFSLPSTDVKKNLSFVELNRNYTYSLPEIRKNKADYAFIGIDVLSDATTFWWMMTKEVRIWKKPDDISKNVFAAIATRELLEHTLFSAIKPWQAPDNNYVFVRIPTFLEYKSKIISEYNFGSEDEINKWQRIDGFPENGNNLVFDAKQGYLSPGSLKIDAVHAPYPVVRWVSPIFSVQSNKAYKAEAWVKAKNIIDLKNRDGFLRIDFYKDDPKNWDEATDSNRVSVSERYFGESRWYKIEVTGIASDEDKFATISFQVSNPANTEFWMDDLVVYESTTEVETRLQSDEYNLSIPINVLVPFSTGGL